MNTRDVTFAQALTAVDPSIAAGEEVNQREVSHVFYCMQCDLQFQVDMAVTCRNGLHEIDARVVHVQLDPHIKLEREG